MSESGSAPRRNRFMAAAALLISSAFLALWQGVGTGLADRAVTIFYPTQQEPSQTGRRAGAPPVSSLAPQPSATTNSPPSPAPSDEMTALEAVVRVRADLDINSTKSGKTQGQACAAAVRDMKLQADSQCQRMLLEHRGVTYRIENPPSECRSCGAVGSGWRCVASATPECIIAGEVE